MKNKYKEIFIILFFLFLTLFTFRDYFLKNLIPFPANLLVSFYEPWVSYKWQGYPSGPPNKPIGFDNLRIFLPIRKITTDQIKKFEWPLWNPYSFSGNTHLATYQSAVFHPLTFLFLLLPLIDAWSVIIILQPFLSGIFMYLFLRELAIGRKESVFGALAFSFSGFMIVRWQESFMSGYSALFLPLILYAIEKIIKKIRLLPCFILVFGLTSSILSGWFQMSLYVWSFAFLWAIYRSNQEYKKIASKQLIYTATLFFISFLIAGIHLIPNMESYVFSARGSTDAKFLFTDYLVPITHIITFIAPDFFGNPGYYNYFGKGFYYEKVLFISLPALIFGLYELYNIREKENKKKFFKWAFLITLSLGISLPTSWFFLYSLKLPFLSTILPSRIFFISTFCLSVLSAYGLQEYIKNANRNRLLKVLGSIAIVILIAVVVVAYERIFNYHPKNYLAIVSLKNIILPIVLFIICGVTTLIGLQKNTNKLYVFYVLIIISIVSTAYFTNKYLYFSERKFLFPQVPVLTQLTKIAGIDRIWTSGKGYIDKNFLSYYNLASPEGYDSFYISRYGELLHSAIHNGKYSPEIQRADATLSPIGKNEGMFKDERRNKLMSILGVKYFVMKKNDSDTNFNEKMYSSEQILKKWEDDEFVIYEYKNAYPRVFIVGDYKIAVNNQKILDLIYSKDIDLKKTVILEENPNLQTKKPHGNGNAKIIKYSPNKVEIKTETDNEGILFLSDNYFPGWQAVVDGKNTKIYRANYSFRSIVVPSGTHTVVFEYKPLSLYAGVGVSILGILLLTGISMKIKYRQI